MPRSQAFIALETQTRAGAEADLKAVGVIMNPFLCMVSPPLLVCTVISFVHLMRDIVVNIMQDKAVPVFT